VAIFAARKRFELPRLDEGFDRLFIVDLDEQEGRFVVRPDRPVTAGVYRS
jgi:hypothetical protein